MNTRLLFLASALLAAGTLSATTIRPEKVKCGNCGEENTVTVIGSVLTGNLAISTPSFG